MHPECVLERIHLASERQTKPLIPPAKETPPGQPIYKSYENLMNSIDFHGLTKLVEQSKCVRLQQQMGNKKKPDRKVWLFFYCL
jgi:hypothetical protein